MITIIIIFFVLLVMIPLILIINIVTRIFEKYNLIFGTFLCKGGLDFSRLIHRFVIRCLLFFFIIALSMMIVYPGENPDTEWNLWIKSVVELLILQLTLRALPTGLCTRVFLTADRCLVHSFEVQLRSDMCIGISNLANKTLCIRFNFECIWLLQMYS